MFYTRPSRSLEKYPWRRPNYHQTVTSFWHHFVDQFPFGKTLYVAKLHMIVANFTFSRRRLSVQFLSIYVKMSPRLDPTQSKVGPLSSTPVLIPQEDIIRQVIWYLSTVLLLLHILSSNGIGTLRYIALLAFVVKHSIKTKDNTNLIQISYQLEIDIMI